MRLMIKKKQLVNLTSSNTIARELTPNIHGGTNGGVHTNVGNGHPASNGCYNDTAMGGGGGSVPIPITGRSDVDAFCEE
jgi:hypothetical protein